MIDIKFEKPSPSKYGPSAGNPTALFIEQLYARVVVKDYVDSAVKPGDNVYVREDA